MRYPNAEACWEEIKKTLNRDLLEDIAGFARQNEAPTSVTFGTSGWRGIIGSDFTLRNVKVVTQAIVNILKSEDPSLRKALGTEDFEEVKRRGIIVGRDNRFMGDEFSKAVMSLLTREGIKVFYAGQTTTPEISASIEMLNAACSINIT
ncbi:MAG: phosphomannomutase, partial [Nitrospirae bacterium]